MLSIYLLFYIYLSIVFMSVAALNRSTKFHKIKYASKLKAECLFPSQTILRCTHMHLLHTREYSLFYQTREQN